MKTYFKDSALQQQFDRDGYVIIDRVLDEKQISELTKLFKSIEPPELNKMYCNIYARSFEENKKIDNILVNAFSEKFNQIFQGCRMVNGVFLAKGNGSQTASVMHQDWSSVDETYFDSLAMWTPLKDVDETNGCVYVIKGSHRMFNNTLRSMTIPPLYLDFDSEINPYLTPAPMKAGQTLIYAHNLFHGSKPKYNGDTRTAIVIGVVPTEAKTIYFFYDKSAPDLVELFETNTDFYLNGISKYLNQQRPDVLPKIGEFRGNLYLITREEFFETLRKNKHSTN